MVTAVWDELSKTTTTATNALGNNSLSQAIEQSTTAIQLLRNQFVTLLEIRATAWAKAGNSSKELEDALTMVDIAPHCSTGYLRSSTLYANLGYQKSAVEILEKGVDNVPHHDPQYISLVQNAMIAQMQLRRRVDFITTCPPEIVCIILDKVSMDDLYDCICVSTTWRKIIVHHPYRWKTFKISDFKSNSVELLLPVVSPYIEELHVWGSQTFIGKQLTVIQTNQFSRLRSLNINHEPYTSQSSIRLPSCIPIYEGIINTLPKIGNQLTRLDFSKVFKLPPLAAILSACPNLLVFNHEDPIGSPWFKGLSSISYTTQLTKIVVCFGDYYAETEDSKKIMPSDEMASLIRHSPALEHIYLDNCSCCDLLPTIVKCCSNLKQLWFNKSDMYDEGFYVPYPVESQDEKNATNENKNMIVCATDGGSSLAHLLLCGHFPLDGSVITRLLEKNCDSLQRLYICPKSQKTVPTTSPSAAQHQDIHWENDLLSTTFTMTALNLLHIEQSSKHQHRIISDTITQLLEQSPNISSLTLIEFIQDDQYGISNDVADAMTRLKSLQFLTLEESFIPIGSSLGYRTSSYSDYFPSLLSLNIKECGGVTDALLHSVARIQTLEDILIEEEFNDTMTTPSGLNAFASLLAQLPCLKELILLNMELSDETVQNLSLSKSLNNAEFTGKLVSKKAMKYLRTHGIPQVGVQ